MGWETRANNCKKKKKNSPQPAFRSSIIVSDLYGAKRMCWNRSLQFKKLLHKTLSEAFCCCFLSLFPGFDCNFDPWTLTVSFRMGVVTRRYQSNLALGYNTADPKGGLAHYGPLRPRPRYKRMKMKWYNSLQCGTCRPRLHSQFHVRWLHVRDNTEACEAISRATCVYICMSWCWGENRGCLVH